MIQRCTFCSNPPHKGNCKPDAIRRGDIMRERDYKITEWALLIKLKTGLGTEEAVELAYEVHRESEDRETMDDTA